MKRILICILVAVSANAFSFCTGGFNDPNYQACMQQEESNRIQKEMLEVQRQQLEQQRIDNMMRQSDIRNNDRW
ncbi:Uncharacterised protein [Legionella donaldsonii]|uniref:Uncharacterized protein n=1 Tax=Legionella donaldsonii TaxID=45060 RepID=A0A378J9D2_9GAMM|nr:hypothetical protein [Legionella donaldsonii]STX43956.1 Uncharacterised protein [Legionella donaldsonii]